MFDVVIRNLNDAFGYGVWIISKEEESIGPRKIKVLRLGPMTWEEFDVGHRLPQATFDTSTREGDLIFEKFIGALKEMGFGRDKVSVESGELKATKEHLTDMKKLVFEPPKHFAPIIISPGQQSIDLGTDFRGGRITPGRAWYSTPADLKISASRVLKAAKKCGNAAEVLKELFPEVFGPGWERFKDETD